MDKINEMIEKRAKLWEEAKNFLDTHTDEDIHIDKMKGAAET